MGSPSATPSISHSDTPKAVLFDVGNVIVRWSPRTLYSKIFPDPAECDRFLSEVCTLAWHLKSDLGQPMAVGVAELSARHPEHAGAIAAWKDRWSEMFSGVIPETIEAIEALHARGVPLFGLTNMAVETSADTFAMHPAFGLLRDVVISGAEGAVKPDPRIYQIACVRSGYTASELLFIDDSAINIEAARALGFHVHLFDDPAALAPVLRGYGLI